MRRSSGSPFVLRPELHLALSALSLSCSRDRLHTPSSAAGLRPSFRCQAKWRVCFAIPRASPSLLWCLCSARVHPTGQRIRARLGVICSSKYAATAPRDAPQPTSQRTRGRWASASCSAFFLTAGRLKEHLGTGPPPGRGLAPPRPVQKHWARCRVPPLRPLRPLRPLTGAEGVGGRCRSAAAGGVEVASRSRGEAKQSKNGIKHIDQLAGGTGSASSTGCDVTEATPVPFLRGRSGSTTYDPEIWRAPPWRPSLLVPGVVEVDAVAGFD